MSKATERCDSLPGCNYAIWQDSEEFCFTTDAVFLATFPHLVRQARVLELGAGTGAISLLLAARGAAQVVGVDCNPHVVELMRRSIAANGLEECVSAELADLRELKALYRSESFDLIAANPPYRNSGKVRRVATAACHELTATLEDFFRAAAYLVKYRGRFAIVQLPERFTECMELALKYGLQPKNCNGYMPLRISPPGSFSWKWSKAAVTDWRFCRRLLCIMRTAATANRLWSITVWRIYY